MLSVYITLECCCIVNWFRTLPLSELNNAIEYTIKQKKACCVTSVASMCISIACS